jgi:hypothetical protein
MKMNQQQLERLIDKMLNIIKPNGVSDIDYNLDSLDNHGNEYYMSVTYIVPDDSKLLQNGKALGFSDFYKQRWNREIHNTIKNYFDVDVIISMSAVMTESYYKRLKHY